MSDNSVVRSVTLQHRMYNEKPFANIYSLPHGNLGTPLIALLFSKHTHNTTYDYE